MAGVESGAAALLAGPTTGGFASAGLGPIVAGANAGPGVEVMAVALLAGAGLLLSAGTRGRGLDLGRLTGAGAGRALLMDSGRGATTVSGASGRAEARMTTKVQPMITEATTPSCSGRRPPACPRAGEACATGSCAGAISGYASFWRWSTGESTVGAGAGGLASSHGIGVAALADSHGIGVGVARGPGTGVGRVVATGVGLGKCIGSASGARIGAGSGADPAPTGTGWAMALGAFFDPRLSIAFL